MGGPIRILELRSVRGTGGGPDKTILYGARDTDPTRFAVTVCYMRDRRDAEFTIDRRARELGLDYIEILERHSFDPAIWPALRAIVRDRKIQIVHAHDYKTNLLAWLVAKREPVIALSTVHGWFGREMWRERLYYSVDKRVLARFPCVIAVSHTLKNELVAAGCRADRITMVPNGIDHRLFARAPGTREALRRSLGIGADDVVIGAVGRLERQKRFDLLMDVVARLRARHAGLRLFIVGAGGLEDELKAVHRRLRLSEACVFLGHRADVPVLHNAFDLFVQSSDREGSPNVVLEAMALGTPIVATDVGGTRDLVSHGVHGLIVPPSDGQALESGIERALADWPATLVRAAAARRRVEEELSFDRRMDTVEAIYEDLVNQ